MDIPGPVREEAATSLLGNPREKRSNLFAIHFWAAVTHVSAIQEDQLPLTALSTIL